MPARESRKILDQSEFWVLGAKQIPHLICGLTAQIDVEHLSIVVGAVPEPQCQLRHSGIAGHVTNDLCLLLHLRHDYLFHGVHSALTTNVCHLGSRSRDFPTSRIRSSSANAGSSLGSCGTSSPRKAVRRVRFACPRAAISSEISRSFSGMFVRMDSFEQDRRWFIVGTLGNQFTAE